MQPSFVLWVPRCSPFGMTPAMDLRLDHLLTYEHLLAYGGLGGGRTCKGCVSPASNQRNSQILQTSILIPPLLSAATSIIGLLQEGQGRARLPSLWTARSHSGLIDSPAKVRRNNCKPTARPSHFSQRQMMPLPVRISVNGIRQAGQRSSIAAACSGGRASCNRLRFQSGSPRSPLRVCRRCFARCVLEVRLLA